MTAQDLQQIQSIVTGAKRVLVITHKNPSFDTMASALSLYLASIRSGKDAVVAMESEPLVEIADLVGINKVQTQLGGSNIVVTLSNYNTGEVERVSATEDLEGGKFNVTLVPKSGVVLDAKNVSLSSSGGSFDLIYTVEVTAPENLGKLYDPNLFSGTQVINIDNHDENKDYGRFNLVEPDAASISEITTFFLRAIGIQMDEDIAGNLSRGLRAATNNFTSEKINPATFEAAAICLRVKQKPQPQVPKPKTGQQPEQSEQPQQSMPQNNQTQSPVKDEVPADWIGPKIYRGGGNV